MPKGKGTYGKKVGRPPKKKQTIWRGFYPPSISKTTIWFAVGFVLWQSENGIRIEASL